MIGRSLSHYRILEALGAGGMGEVYRAEDTRLRRQVAIKLLPEGLAADAAALARFEQEARAVAALFDRRAAATLALVVGLGLLAWSAFEVARIVWNTTFAGLWLTWAGALVLTLAGLDADGKVQGVWVNVAKFTTWRVDNLSTITGADPLTGQLDVTVTPWGGIRFVGADSNGHIVGTWWNPGRGPGNWT